MKTLKDLNDIKGVDYTCERLTKDRIKAEAIKWVKFYNNEIQRLIEIGQKEDAHYVLGKKRGIIEFHNITEEDLSQTELKGGKSK